MLVVASGGGRTSPQLPLEILQPSGKLPARLVERIESPRAFVETSSGIALVLDGGTHGVYAVDTARATSRRIIDVGYEPGRILNPSGFALGPNDILAITDTPGGLTRVQYFDETGRQINAFYVAPQPGARMALGRITLRSAGALAFTGRTFIINAPSMGALMSEFDATAEPVRSIGVLRPTGHEADAALHAALNAGIPLIDSRGGFYFVFETGVPMFRRYTAAGTLAYERHIEGAELDSALTTLPTRWADRSSQDGVWPIVPTYVRSAAVDAGGRLWVSLSGGVTYVYDARGDKIRTVQFRAGDTVVVPTSLHFAARNRILVTPGCYEFRAD